MLFGKISMHFHAPFVNWNNFQLLSKFRVRIANALKPAMIDNIILLAFSDAISNLSSIQFLLSDKAQYVKLQRNIFLPRCISRFPCSNGQYSLAPILCCSGSLGGYLVNRLLPCRDKVTYDRVLPQIVLRDCRYLVLVIHCYFHLSH